MTTATTRLLPSHLFALAACALLLQACGGGGSGSASAMAPTVSAITPAATLSYGRLATFTASGSNLATAASFNATGCDGFTLLTGGSATQQQFTCTPNQALSVRVAASSGGAEVFNSTITVAKPRVTLSTTLGSLVVELEPGVVKLTVDNFLAYVNANFYNGTIFHRVIPGFVVQGGGFTGVSGSTLTPQAGLGSPIALEVNKGLSNTRGTIAMARTDVLGSATSQFYFNSVNNTALDTSGGGYAVFGRIVSDLAVLDVMNAVSTRTVGTNADVPVTNIVLQTAVRTQ